MKTYLPQWADTTRVNPDRTEPPAEDTSGHWEEETAHDYRTLCVKTFWSEISFSLLPDELVIRQSTWFMDGDGWRGRRVLNIEQLRVKHWSWIFIKTNPVYDNGERTCWSRVKVRVSRTNWETESSAVDGYRTRLTSQPLKDTTQQQRCHVTCDATKQRHTVQHCKPCALCRHCSAIFT